MLRLGVKAVAKGNPSDGSLGRAGRPGVHVVAQLGREKAFDETQVASIQRDLDPGPELALPVEGGIRVVKPFGLFGACEHSLECVVILLSDGIELVVVAAGAVRRDAGERRHHVRHDVVAVDVTANLAIEGVLADVAQGTFIPGTRRQKTEGRDAFGFVREEGVGGDLFLDEAVVGPVLVERVDDVFAVAPGGFSGTILVVSVGFGEMNDVEPVPGPAFAVTGGGQQAIDPTLHGVGGGVLLKFRDLLRCGQESMKIQGQSSKQRAAVRHRGRLAGVGLGQDQGVNGMRAVVGRQGGFEQGPEGP